MVSTRYSQSSVSNAEANQLKLIQALTIANIASTKATTALPACPSATISAKYDAEVPTATTKVRSNSSSSGEDTRPGSSGSRPVIGMRRCAGPRAPPVVTESLMGTDDAVPAGRLAATDPPGHDVLRYFPDASEDCSSELNLFV